MARMILSITDLPYSVNGVAGSMLTVSVTDANGAPYTSLQRPNFEVRWIVDAGVEVETESIDVTEYRSAQHLPNMPGVYAISVRAKTMHWARLSSNRFFFLIRVHEDQNHGQTIHPVTDLSIVGL